MAWYWYLVIIAAVLLVLLLIALFGSTKVRAVAYELVCNAEKLVGQGEGQEKFNLVFDNLEKITKGILPKSFMKSVIEWAVTRMKEMLKEDPKSVEKHKGE